MQTFTPTQAENRISLVTQHIPICALSNFENTQIAEVYAEILEQLIKETLVEGSTLLQALIVERTAFYFVQMRMLEMDAGDKRKVQLSDEYKFFVKEYNYNLDILRKLSYKNLSEQQRTILAQRTLSVIEKVVKNPEDKDIIIKALIKEYTIEVKSNQP